MRKTIFEILIGKLWKSDGEKGDEKTSIGKEILLQGTIDLG